MSRSEDPRTALSQFIGGRFHQDAFVDGVRSVDEIVDQYLRGATPRKVAAASAGARQLLGETGDERDLGSALGGMGFSFVPESLGFHGYRALLNHVVGRLDEACAEAPVLPDDGGDEPAPPLASRERHALTSLLQRVDADITSCAQLAQRLSEWRVATPPDTVMLARSAARALRGSALLDTELLDELQDLGLRVDVVDHAGIGLNGLLDLIKRELDETGVEPPHTDAADNARDA